MCAPTSAGDAGAAAHWSMKTGHRPAHHGAATISPRAAGSCRHSALALAGHATSTRAGIGLRQGARCLPRTTESLLAGSAGHGAPPLSLASAARLAARRCRPSPPAVRRRRPGETQTPSFAQSPIRPPTPRRPAYATIRLYADHDVPDRDDATPPPLPALPGRASRPARLPRSRMAHSGLPWDRPCMTTSRVGSGAVRPRCARRAGWLVRWPTTFRCRSGRARVRPDVSVGVFAGVPACRLLLTSTRACGAAAASTTPAVRCSALTRAVPIWTAHAGPGSYGGPRRPLPPGNTYRPVSCRADGPSRGGGALQTRRYPVGVEADPCWLPGRRRRPASSNPSSWPPA